MKINRLNFENINSLAGKWEIDFTDPAFNDGIFILAGPTGAGKTSILDAVCLALYGETSRQRTFSAKENEVMTKGTSFCFSQVEFESQGKKYRALWEHRRKKGSEEYQSRVCRKIYDLSKADEPVAAETIKDADREIVRILKMDFKQFTSAVLLPQGQFDKFLSSDKKIRSEILEKITGAWIYSQIGSAVHDRKGKEDTELKVLQKSVSLITPLDEEEENAVAGQIIKARTEAAEKEKRFEELAAERTACKKSEELKQEIKTLTQTLASLKAEEERHLADFNSLELAKKAAALFPLTAAWEQSEEQSRKMIKEIREMEKKLPREFFAEPEIPGAEHADALPECADAEEVMQTVREIALEGQLVQNSREQKEAAFKKTGEVAAESKKLSREETQKAAVLAEKIDGLSALVETAETNRAALLAEAESLDGRIRELSVISSSLSFEEARKKLKDGEACPLCGSTDHPFCTERDEFEKRQNIFRELSEQKKKTEKLLRDAGAEKEKLTAEKNNAEKMRAVTEERQTALEAAFAEAESAAALVQKELCVLEAKTCSAAHAWKVRSGGLLTFLAERNKARRREMEASFAENGFSGHEEWRRFFWETGKIALVERKKAELAARIAGTETSLAEKKKEAAELSPFSPGGLARIEEAMQMLREEINACSRTTGELGARLAENEERKKRRAECEKNIAEQTAVCRNWKQMDDWIGGGGGWRFKQFAQAITFKQLVYNARPYLLRMSGGRYELQEKTIGDELLPLVIDRHQGSIERVISNLSGGERFLLSLSLALGLSKLNSKNLQIDSLFLDEGFGTLDKETLELAVNILSGLQQNQGKLTGIISHVEELQERITAIIRVSKSGGGRSTLSGCGIRQL